jgi:uncharacterized protein involved in outer membrane biogenesis
MRFLHWLLIAAGVLGVLLMLALGPGSIWINSFIHSDSFRHEVETRAGQTLGGTVEIKEIDFSIWSGVQLSGLATKFESPQGTVVAQMEGVNCSLSFVALLSRRLELNGLTLVKPQIVLTQEPPSTVATPAPPPVPAKAEATPQQVTSGTTSAFQFILNSAKVSDGRLSIRDATGATKADLQGIQIGTNTSGYYTGKDVTGTIRIATVALPQNLALTNFSTPFTYRTGAVEVTPFEATAFGGRLTGDYKLDPSAPSLLEVNATRIDVGQVGQVANPGSPTKLSGSLALQSKWQGVETGKLTGQGDAQITDGRLTGVSILKDLAFALRVNELAEPVLKSVTTHFQVAEGSTRFTGLTIESNVFEMTGSGVIDPQGRLSADMVLTLHGGAMGGIPGVAASFFSKLPGGAGSIPFHISGTVASPQADLSTRLFLQGSKVQKTINNTVNKAINHFFH